MAGRGWDVWVMMTEAATSYVGPLTFHALTRHPVPSGRCEATPSEAFQHLNLAGADAIVIAPCTANVAAKLAHGLADDIVTATVLAASSPVIVAPAMNEGMWKNPATQENIAVLKKRGITVLDVESGELACGVVGAGRLCSLEKIVEAVEQAVRSPK
jgi:phosphopantothenoylcysteine decarboxylase/phosphopantothenate--cysteine ligase